ncbi:Uncharacterized protein involved in outer membrane biogenesis [Marinobacter persicus]|uniref:Uncharacterized protein involved in outer membrane biogenesis n=1 Tax=Marinobacter persicus TaxID=930118 RepID=A0A1I3VAZ4_9GAMM|nr:DUF748 domain-containing protein [Marinobacter persicus]GHD41360.1 hypothetical protein GCM10008110_03340 [Marinobacter persicus]SFJ92310.1 Uncharacterized protein involved in outer membrane biogenesis [Marinobacter persicus]
MGEQKAQNPQTPPQPVVHQRRWPRYLLVGVVLLVLLYTLAGFLLLPWWLERALPEQLEKTMGWQAEITDIRTNPYALTLEADGLQAVDSEGEPVVGFEHFRVNVSFFQLLTGVIGFQEITLDQPDIRLDLLDDYSVNYARDFRAANPPADSGPETPESSDPGEPLKLYFEQLAVNGGELRFRDFTQDEMAEFRLQPLDLSLDDLATWPRDADSSTSRYSLAAEASDQIIEWEGELSVAPLYSRGSVRLSDIRHDTLAHFLKPFMPWQLREGSVTLTSDYRLSASNGLELTTSDGQLTVRDLAMALSGQAREPALSAAEIAVQGIDFDLTGKEASVGLVAFDQLAVGATRDSDGVIDWVASLPGAGENTGREEEGASRNGEQDVGTSLRWSVQGVELTDSRIDWRDEVPETPAQVRLNEINASISGLSHRLEEPVSYQLTTTLASGGRLSANGQLTPVPFTFESALSGSDVALVVAEPYLQTAANLALRDGRLGFDGNLDLDAQTDPMTGTFSGTAQVAGLDVRLAEQNDPLVAWKNLRLAPIEYNVHPARLEVGTVTVSEPVASIVRDADSLHNVQRIAKAGVQGESPDSEEQAPAQAGTDNDERPPLIFRIGELQVESGVVAYADRTLDPAFSTTFDALNGSVSGISNVPPQEGRVNLKGRLAGVAPVDFTGTLGALGGEDTSELSLSMDNLSLPVLSPYFGRYLGYAVDSGKLQLDMDYDITGSRLKASNKVILDQMQLGRSVASEQAVNAPVKLGLALLTDRQGVIEVDLPIEGDMANPEFSVGQVVMRAFVNLLAKAAASPFTMLGSIADLAGFSSEELGQVAFEPGGTLLAGSETDKLAALANALKDRPELLLEIRGAVAPEADGLALLKEQMAANGEETTGPAWEQARQAYLAGERSLPSETLGQLANQRALEVRRILEQTHEVPTSQLFLLDPSRDGALTEAGEIIVPFTLDVR